MQVENVCQQLKTILMYKINEYTADVNRYKFPSVSKSSEQP